jgi:hypothetical protein
MGSPTKEEREAFSQRRDEVVDAISDLLTAPGPVSAAVYHYAIISSALGVEKKLDQLIADCTPNTRSPNRREESTREVMVACLISILNRLLEREPLRLR